MDEKSKILITNKTLLQGKRKAEHELYEYTKYEITKRSEFSQCYIAIYEIPPRKANYPFHFHEVNTEAFYIISGIGVIETLEGEQKIKAGDIIVCPPKKEGAHRIVNTSENECLTYIDFDTTNSPDLVHYPKSDKVGVIVHNQSSTFFRNESQVDYYDGE
ncbi:cupin domain-containing protein [Fusibacter ferrireducens]|uniref:Cupin domain-containing protein n=1 Tax=Fusibacter ferrireducens TaxID=2785058 RepID=A0ABR9ZTF9_9FIRM|nr:cupin domain-containing protein [Fusibacter ferrireducens]MBF4693760.1 cupin domain-containing protein [Fusibacter ferrireducens]